MTTKSATKRFGDALVYSVLTTVYGAMKCDETEDLTINDDKNQIKGVEKRGDPLYSPMKAT